MRSIFLILAFFVMPLAGCDGVDIYPYNGQLIDPAGHPVAKTKVAANASDYDPATLLTNMGVLTDADGRFNGKFTVGTFWLLSIRPPSPILDKVYFYVDKSPSPKVVVLPLGKADQPAIGSGERRVDLGRVVCP
jgi:hypothetical protein